MYWLSLILIGIVNTQILKLLDIIHIIKPKNIGPITLFYFND